MQKFRLIRINKYKLQLKLHQELQFSAKFIVFICFWFINELKNFPSFLLNWMKQVFAHVCDTISPSVVFTSVICYILLLCSTVRQLMAEKLFLRWCANSSSIYNLLYSHYRRRARTDCRHVYTFNEKNYFTLEFWYSNTSLSIFRNRDCEFTNILYNSYFFFEIML